MYSYNGPYNEESWEPHKYLDNEYTQYNILRNQQCACLYENSMFYFFNIYFTACFHLDLNRQNSFDLSKFYSKVLRNIYIHKFFFCGPQIHQNSGGFQQTFWLFSSIRNWDNNGQNGYLKLCRHLIHLFHPVQLPKPLLKWALALPTSGVQTSPFQTMPSSYSIWYLAL